VASIDGRNTTGEAEATGGIDRRTLFRRATGLTAGLSLAGMGIPFAGPASAQAPKPAVPALGKAYFGAYDPVYPEVTPHTGVSVPENDLENAAMLGNTFAINHCFMASFSSNFPLSRFTARWAVDLEAGRIPMLSVFAGDAYNSADLTSFGAGGFDSDVDALAQAMAAFGHPMFLRFGWEMDLSGHFSGFSTTAAKQSAYKQAFLHMHNKLVSNGATNVAMVWCPSQLAFGPNGTGVAGGYYPNDTAVDWVGVDGYARPSGSADTPDFTSLFLNANVFALQANDGAGKPLMVAETGAHRFTQQEGVTSGATAQSSWYDNVRTTLEASPRKFDNLRALVLFYLDGDNSPNPNHWRVTDPGSTPFLNSNGSAAQALKALAANSRLVWAP